MEKETEKYNAELNASTASERGDLLLKAIITTRETVNLLLGQKNAQAECGGTLLILSRCDHCTAPTMISCVIYSLLLFFSGVGKRAKLF